jgi:hypothetical protein
MTSESSYILCKNIGFNPNFFTKTNTFIIKQEKFKKNFSDGAIVQLPQITKSPHEAEDVNNFTRNDGYNDIYSEVDEYNPFCEEKLVDSYINTDQELAIFKNCAKDQISNLNAIMTRYTEADKVIVKAYKSKLKSKFYQIYEHNSKIQKESTKYKLFHRCNFPGCNRTFASSGWLKSHFNEHMKEIKMNKFNVLFDEFIEQMKKFNFG